jgi:hypothetical protein
MPKWSDRYCSWTCTAGVWPFQVQNNDEVCASFVKSTRSQPGACQVRTSYPAAGVAETSRADVAVIESTTCPPASV